MRETELAHAVRDYLELDGWTTYAEVPSQDGGNIADIAATRGPSESLIVEVKAKRCRSVIEQAARWRGQATMVYVAVPQSAGLSGANPRLVDSLQSWGEHLTQEGVGEFVVASNGDVGQVISPVRRKVDGLGIRACLREEHRTYAEAGNSDGKRWGATADLRERFLAVAEPGLRLADLDISDQERASLRRLLKQGSVPGWEVRHGQRCYPTAFNRHRASKSGGETGE